MSQSLLHLEEKYNTLVVNGDMTVGTDSNLSSGVGDGFYLLSLNQMEKRGPYCEIYNPYLVRMISPSHCIFVTQKSNDSTFQSSTLNANLNQSDKFDSSLKSYTIMVFNIEQNKIMLHFTIGHKILNIITVNEYILIVTISQILVYSQNILTNNNDPNNIAFVKTIHTFTNSRGLCSAKCNKNILVIATLGRCVGEIMICTLKKKSNLYIQAHNYNITNVVLDDKCELVGTTSESGTLINVFDIPNCTKVYQFRRGIFGTTIHNIEFNCTSNYITCCSDNGSVHVFHLYDKCNNNVEQKNTTSNFSVLGSIVPVCHSEWAYKLFKINPHVKAKSYFIKENDVINIHVVANDLMYYIINDVEKNQDTVIKHDISKLLK